MSVYHKIESITQIKEIKARESVVFRYVKRNKKEDYINKFIYTGDIWTTRVVKVKLENFIKTAGDMYYILNNTVFEKDSLLVTLSNGKEINLYFSSHLKAQKFSEGIMQHSQGWLKQDGSVFKIIASKQEENK